MSEELKKMVFLDRDGVLIYEPTDTKQVDSPDNLKILDGVVDGLRKLLSAGFELVMVSNQDGLGTALFPREKFDAVQNKLLVDFKSAGVEFYQVFICPHLPQDGCGCRKPRTGLVENFLSAGMVDLSRSLVIGDRESDRQFAENIGVSFLQARTNGKFPRIFVRARTTAETKIFIVGNLDGRGNYNISTGIKFFDHMLEQASKNSLIDLVIQSRGDLAVDEHHTVEDVGLSWGEAMARALGDKRGIGRFGFLLPMDESLAETAIDLSGRPRLVFNARFKREAIGDLPTELIEDFFQALAVGLGASIHINLRYGRNDHHQAEAIFKSLGRALRQAVALDPRTADIIPSTKGIL